MTTHSPPRTISWDVFCASQTSDDLRSFTLLASQLASSQAHRVRVFIDDPGRLSALSARIESMLWWQPLANYDLVKLRLADAVTPADHVVCSEGTELPVRYRERLAYGAGNRCKLYRLWPLGHPAPAEAANAPGQLSGLLIDVIQDDRPGGVGIIKDPRGLADMRARWKSHPSLSQTTLESLGLPGHLADNALIVCNWGAAMANPREVLSTLTRASDKPVLFLVGPADALDAASMAAMPSSTGSLRVQKLPELSWSQLDEVIWSIDLLFCGQRDAALRAMECGTPMMWMPRAQEGKAGDNSLSDWYYDDLDLGSRRRLIAMTQCVRDDTSEPQALAWYVKQRDDLDQIARQVARRMAQARNLADVLPTLSPALLEKAKRRKQQQDNANSPTWPMSLPEQRE